MTVECHYPAADEVTAYQKQKIAELRQKAAKHLAKYPDYDTDFSLLRWLMGWDYDVDLILPKLQYSLDVLTCLRLDELKVENVSEINAKIRSMSSVAEYFPGGLMCQDDEGNVVYMQALSLTHPKTLIRSGAVSELYRLSIVEAELAFKLVRKAEAATKRKLGAKIIIDLDNFSMDVLYPQAVSIYLNLLTLLQALFPDFGRRIYVINSPMMIKTVYAMVQPVLSKQTKEKVTFLGNDWKEVLIRELGEHNIYRHWGGSKASELPTGDVRMGGKVPEKLQYKAEDNVDDDKKGFTKLTVAARSKSEVQIHGEKGKTLRWLMRVTGGDVDFGIKKNNEMVFPTFRITTEFHPEFGSMECKENGDYTLTFDNSHGKIWSKEISYKITLE
nr:Cellular retinaldehyde-binding triple function domain containing protein [Haemonchus contortus]